MIQRAVVVYTDCAATCAATVESRPFTCNSDHWSHATIQDAAELSHIYDADPVTPNSYPTTSPFEDKVILTPTTAPINVAVSQASDISDSWQTPQPESSSPVSMSAGDFLNEVDYTAANLAVLNYGGPQNDAAVIPFSPLSPPADVQPLDRALPSHPPNSYRQDFIHRHPPKPAYVTRQSITDTSGGHFPCAENYNDPIPLNLTHEGSEAVQNSTCVEDDIDPNLLNLTHEVSEAFADLDRVAFTHGEDSVWYDGGHPSLPAFPQEPMFFAR